MTVPFTPGTRVEAWQDGKWRDAIVSSIPTYNGKAGDGRYIIWDPLPKETWESKGGWKPLSYLRERIPG